MPRRACFNKRQVAVAIAFSLWNIIHWWWQDYASTSLNNDTLVHEFDEEKCIKAITSSTNNIASDFLSVEQSERATQLVSKVAMKSTLKGDFFEVNVSSSSSCREIGGFSLFVSIAQRTAINEPFCNLQMAPKRSVWLAISDERCIDVVTKLFQENNFSVVDPNESLGSNSIIDVPIHLLVGPMMQILSESSVEKIALLRIGHPLPRGMVENARSSTMAVHDERLSHLVDDHLTTNTLHALISLYRKVGISGFVALDGVWLDEVKEFLMDGNHTVLNISTNSNYFMKEDTQIRIPIRYRQEQIQPAIDPKVLQAWQTLDEWHKETVKHFVGHVGTNPYQTYRYTEAMRHLVDTQKKRSGHGKEIIVNVCETGFNGGEAFVA